MTRKGEYQVTDGYRLTGTPTESGTFEIELTLYIPLVRGFGSNWPNNTHVSTPDNPPVYSTISQTFTITVAAA